MDDSVRILLSHHVDPVELGHLAQARELLASGNGFAVNGRFAFADHTATTRRPELLAALSRYEYDFRGSGAADVDPRSLALGRWAQHRRPPSLSEATRHVSATELDEARLFEAVGQAFCNSTDETVAEMPYPSAGGIYPVQVLFVALRPTETLRRLGVYHLRPRSRQLDHVGYADERALERCFVTDTSLQPLEADYIVAFAIVPAGVIFKYGCRGYRFSLLEAGAAMQAFTMSAASCGLATRCWGAVDDHALASALGFQPQGLWIDIVQIVQQTITG